MHCWKVHYSIADSSLRFIYLISDVNQGLPYNADCINVALIQDLSRQLEAMFRAKNVQILKLECEGVAWKDKDATPRDDRLHLLSM
jgi:hypothetical protein